MTYDEYKYWSTRLYPTSRDAEYIDANLEYISKCVLGAERLLDFGPGIGRTFSAYQGVGYVEGYDISTIYKERAIERASKLGLTFVLTINTSGDPTYIPYDDKWFDVVIASDTLLHQKPENIVFIMKELIRISKKVVVITATGISSSPHCFYHDYLEICRAQKWTMHTIEYFKEQIFFCYAREASDE